MTAAVAAGAQRCSGSLDPALYDRRPVLSAAERAALDVVCACRSRWPSEVTAALERLARPIDDVVAHINPQPRWWPRSPTRGALMTAMRDQGTAFWGWDRDRWVRVLAATDADVRQPVLAVGYLLCGQRDLHLELRGFKACLFARRVFGGGAVGVALRRVQDHLDALGYAAQLRRPSLQHALCRLMLAAGSARLEDVARPELLRDLRAREPNNARRHGLEQLARTLVDMRLLAQAPFAAAPTREEWLARSRAGELGVPDVWLGWVKRWFSTSTLTTRSREDVYFMLIKAGRWLAREHPEHADPGTWTRELAAAWVAAVDQMLVGEFSHAPNTDYLRRRHGGQLSPRTKAAHIWALSRFFADLQEWDWIGRRFDPRLTFRTPRSVLALIGPDPRVISDDVWAKLMWAGLNLGVEDLPIHASTGGDPSYPLELVRAVTMLWLFAGLRVDEIVRLRLGAIRWQHEPDAGDERPAVCLLDVPVHKTGTAFTKPVDRTVGAAIDAWQARRPPQPALHDRKTDQPVQLLFAYRGAPLSPGYVNRTLIPILCRKAGVPREDVRGQITGHRARATIASQLYNAKDPMSLAELQAWLGHRSAQSTQHYARITPTKLTKAYSDAGYFARNVRAIEVLLDRDAIQTGAATTGEPYEFYDLGHGYCSYSFFEQCPHRMACARCDFYLPKPSSKAQLLEASTSLQRMLVEIPLNEHERAAVEGDQAAIERLVDRLAQVPTPAGPTPLALTEHTPTTRPESPGVRPPSA